NWGEARFGVGLVKCRPALGWTPQKTFAVPRRSYSQSRRAIRPGRIGRGGGASACRTTGLSFTATPGPLSRQGLPFRQWLFVYLEHVLHAGDVLFIQFRDAPHFFPATASVRGSEAGCGSSPGPPAAPVSASPLRWRSAARSTAPCPVAADRTPWRCS